MNIYYDNGVEPFSCVHTCSTLEEAKVWIAHELKGRTMVDDDHQCSEVVMASAKTALYEVFDGDTVTINEKGELALAIPVFSSDYFYSD